MKKIILLSFLFIFMFNLGYSYSFNADEVFLYNNQFFSPAPSDVRLFELLIAGEMFVGWNLEFASVENYIYLEDDTLNVEVEVDRCGTTTISYPILVDIGKVNWTFQYTGLVDDDSQLDITLYNGSYQTSYSLGKGTYTNQLMDLELLNPNYVKMSFHFTCEPEWFFPDDYENRNIIVDSLRLYDKDTTGSSYTMEQYALTNNYHSYSNYIPIGAKTDTFSSPFKYYIYPDYNLTTTFNPNFEYLQYNSYDGVNHNFLSTYSIDEDVFHDDYNIYTGYNVYVLNDKGNSIYYNDITNNILSGLEELSIDVSVQDGSIISYIVPDKTSTLTGTKTTDYIINLYDGLTLVKQYYFPEEDLVTGSVDYEDFSVKKELRNGEYYIDIFGDLSDYDLVTGTYEVRAKYTQNNGTDKSFSFLEKANISLTIKTFDVFSFNGSDLVDELNFYDVIDEVQIYIFPSIGFGDDIGWEYTLENYNSFKTVIPPDFYQGQLIDLDYGETTIKISDSSGIIYTYVIMRRNEAQELLNVTLYNINLEEICSTNQTSSNCDSNIINGEFYSVIYDNDDNSKQVGQRIYCFDNETNNYKFFYNDINSDSNYRNIPRDLENQFSANEILLSYDKPYNMNDDDFNDFLLANPDIITLGEVQFTKNVMNNYIEEKNEEFKTHYLPSGKKCYIEYWWGDSILTVNFTTTYSLLDDIVGKPIYYTIKSQCFINRNQQNGILEYLDYNACIVTSFIGDNYNTFYYLTFFMLGLIIYKVITNLDI